MKKTMIWLSALSALFVLTLGSAEAAASKRHVPASVARATNELRSNQGALLQIKGAQYISVVDCDANTGELILNEFHMQPSIPCLAVHVASPADVARIETVLPNPLIINGIKVHFTDSDPDPAKGGITVSN